MSKYALIDVSVIIYQTYFRFCKSFVEGRQPTEKVESFLRDEMMRLVAPAIAENYEAVFVFDKKKNGNYWRQDFLDNNKEFYRNLWDDPKNGIGLNAANATTIDERYKGGRKSADSYSSLIKRVRSAAELLKENEVYFEEPGLEADDFFGLFAKYSSDTTCLDFVTVDRDISALLQIGNNNIRFINMLPKQRYKIEYAEQVVEYFQKKLHANIKNPGEAYFYKQQLGETGDNLLPNCHIELIDLVNHCAPIEMGYGNAHEKVKRFLK